MPFPLIAAGEQHVASSLAAILIAAVPLIIALLAIRFDPAERATGRRLVGLLGRARRRRRARWASTWPAPRRAARRRRDPDRRGRLRGRADDRSSATWPSSTRARRWARAWRSPRSCSRPFAAARAAERDAPAPTRSRRSLVLGLVCTALAFVIFGALIAEIGPGRALGDHLRQPGGRRRARRRRARRAPRRGRDRRAAADPRRLVAVDRRPAAARSSVVGGDPQVEARWRMKVEDPHRRRRRVAEPWRTPGGTSTNVPGGATSSPSSPSVNTISPSRM